MNCSICGKSRQYFIDSAISYRKIAENKLETFLSEKELLKKEYKKSFYYSINYDKIISIPAELLDLSVQTIVNEFNTFSKVHESFEIIVKYYKEEIKNISSYEKIIENINNLTVRRIIEFIQNEPYEYRIKSQTQRLDAGIHYSSEIVNKINTNIDFYTYKPRRGYYYANFESAALFLNMDIDNSLEQLLLCPLCKSLFDDARNGSREELERLSSMDDD